jgi:alpha-galactosidase
MDPLTGAVLNPPEIWQLVDDMLIAGERWLPQYKRAIAEAKRRAKGGKRLPTREFKGAARLAAKSVEEMARDRETSTRLAGASEKAGKDRATSERRSAAR